MESKEILIENSENWYIYLQRVVLKDWKTNGDRLYVEHKVGKQFKIFITLSLDEINSPKFKSAIELMKEVVLKNEKI